MINTNKNIFYFASSFGYSYSKSYDNNKAITQTKVIVRINGENNFHRVHDSMKQAEHKRRSHKMQAELKKFDGGYIAHFERNLKHPVAKVWSYLTENELLKKWFSELHIDELREDGKIMFDMQDGTFEKFTILELKTHSVLEYTWGDDQVRFELNEKSEGCLLVLEEKIKTITDHTPKDLAGWHVCLDVIAALLNDEAIEREEEWKKWYPTYVAAVKNISETKTS
jgi:uncharacterized protein YndB with AHSA1/START domain